MQERNFRKILIVRLSSLGDVIQTLPVPTVIRRTFPDAEIGWAIDRELAPAIRGHSDVDHIHLCDRIRWSDMLSNPLKWGRILSEGRQFIEEIRQVGYDCALDVQGLLKSAIIPFFAAISPRIGFGHRRELTHFFYTERYLSNAEYFDPDLMHIDHMMVLARAIGCDVDNYRMILPEVTPQNRARVDLLLGNQPIRARPLIAMAPATQWESKQWPYEHWVSLMRLVLTRTEANIVLVGSSVDAALTTRLASAAKSSEDRQRVFNLAGKTSAPELYALFERTCVLIGADTAPLHIAGAAGCRLIGLFGATPTRRTGPVGVATRMTLMTAIPPLACQPCQLRICPYGTTECMRRIAPEDVFSTVFGALTQSAAPIDQPDPHAPAKPGFGSE